MMVELSEEERVERLGQALRKRIRELSPEGLDETPVADEAMHALRILEVLVGIPLVEGAMSLGLIGVGKTHAALTLVRSCENALSRMSEAQDVAAVFRDLRERLEAELEQCRERILRQVRRN